MSIIKLSNGAEIPTIGYGTLVDNLDDSSAISNILFAIENGYRFFFFDTAWVYKNENVVGKAVKKAVAGGGEP